MTNRGKWEEKMKLKMGEKFEGKLKNNRRNVLSGKMFKGG